MQRIIFFLSLWISVHAKAQISRFVPQKPAFARMYNDENAYAYYHKDWRKLEDKLISHHKKMGNQIVIAFIPTTGGYAIDELSTATFRNWGIGDKKNNTGILILIARKEKQIKIEIGYGLEGQVTDLESGVIIRDILEPGLLQYNFQLAPLRKDKAYLSVIERTIDTLIQLTAEKNTEAIKNTESKKKEMNRNRMLTILLYLISAIAILILGKKGWQMLNEKLSSKHRV